MADLTPILITAAAISQRELVATALKALFLPTLNMAGEAIRDSIGDTVSRWRGQNAAATLELAGKKLLEQGLDVAECHHIRTAVGLELLEKASLEDDRIIQEMWANLMVAAVVNSEGSDEVTIDTLQINALHHMNRVDCDVLRFLIEYSCKEVVARDGKRALQTNWIHPESAKKVHPKSHISIEKLIHLGCARQSILTPKIEPTKTYGPDEDRRRPSGQSVMPTLIGINLYIAASGEWPENLSGFEAEARSDEVRTD